MSTSRDWRSRLITWFERLSGLERSYLICTIVAARQPTLRAIAALFLQSRAGVLGASDCIEQLARDDDPVVRRLIARAARARHAESQDGFAAVLDALARDPDPGVATAARGARLR